jgi:hypothetical protein
VEGEALEREGREIDPHHLKSVVLNGEQAIAHAEERGAGAHGGRIRRRGGTERSRLDDPGRQRGIEPSAHVFS